MGVVVRRRKDKTGWWVFVNHRSASRISFMLPP